MQKNPDDGGRHRPEGRSLCALVVALATVTASCEEAPISRQTVHAVAPEPTPHPGFVTAVREKTPEAFIFPSYFDREALERYTLHLDDALHIITAANPELSDTLNAATIQFIPVSEFALAAGMIDSEAVASPSALQHIVRADERVVHQLFLSTDLFPHRKELTEVVLRELIRIRFFETRRQFPTEAHEIDAALTESIPALERIVLYLRQQGGSDRDFAERMHGLLLEARRLRAQVISEPIHKTGQQ